MRHGIAFVLTCLLVLAVAGDASGGVTEFSMWPTHPRAFVRSDSDVALWRVRCDIGSSADSTLYPDQDSTHTAEWASLQAAVRGYFGKAFDHDDVADGIDLNGTEWSQGDCGRAGDVFKNLMVAWRVAAGTSEQAFADSVWDYLTETVMDTVIAHSKLAGNGTIADIVQGSDNDNMWERGDHVGLLMTYDWSVDTLRAGTDTDTLRADEWTQVVWHAIDQTTGAVENFNQINYNADHMREGYMAAQAVIYADEALAAISGYSQQEVDQDLDQRFQVWEDQNEFHDQFWYGMVRGYLNQIPQSMIPNMLMWDAATTDSLYTTYSDHYQNMADWFVRWSRPDGYRGTHTGDQGEFDAPYGTMVYYYYALASMAEDGTQLAALDSIAAHSGLLSGTGFDWAEIMWNDKAVTRVPNPASTAVDYSKHFGDFDTSNGESPYTTYRSNMVLGENNNTSVWAWMYCGSNVGGHQGGGLNGHITIGRGNDLLTCRRGPYDGTSPYINGVLWRANAMSGNTIRIVNPSNTYDSYSGEPLPIDFSTITDLTDAGGWSRPLPYMHLSDGNSSQGFRPCGAGFDGSLEDYLGDCWRNGGTTKFKYFPSGDSYTLADMTRAFPNGEASFWSGAETVDNLQRAIFHSGLGEYFIIGERVDAHFSASSSTTIYVTTQTLSDSTATIVLDAGDWTGGGSANDYGGTAGMYASGASGWYYDHGDSRLHQTVVYPTSGVDIVRIGGPNSVGDWTEGTRFLSDTDQCILPYATDPVWDETVDTNISFEFYSRQSGHNYALCTDGFGCDCGSGLTQTEYDDDWTPAGLAKGGRVELEYDLAGTSAEILIHVYQASDTSTATTSVSLISDYDGLHLGTELATSDTTRVFIFSIDDAEDGSADYQTNATDGWFRHYIESMKPGAYAIFGDEGFVASSDVDAQGVLTFRSPHGGRFEIHRSHDLYAKDVTP